MGTQDTTNSPNVLTCLNSPWLHITRRSVQAHAQLHPLSAQVSHYPDKHICCCSFLTMGDVAAVHIYLCDDSPKDYKEQYNGQTFMTVALRQQMIDALYQVHGIPVIRVTRVKGKGETNPKSANLNNCLKQIYGDAIPPESEVVAVFDADQAAHSH